MFDVEEKARRKRRKKIGRNEKMKEPNEKLQKCVNSRKKIM